MGKKDKIYIAIIIFIFLGNICFFAAEKSKVSIVNTTIRAVKGYYYKNVSAQSLVEGSLRGAVSSLNDRYSYYMSKNQFKGFLKSVNGEKYVGVGIILTKKKNKLMIEDALLKGPAYKAGLREGDIILKIDEEPLTDGSLFDALKLLKGKVDSKVKLKIKRDKEIKWVTVTRKNINSKYVDHKMIDKNIGYIQVAKFVPKISEKVRKSVEELQDQGAKSFILDLRENPGGSLPEAISMAEIFLKKGTPIVKVAIKGEKDKLYTSKKTPETNSPLVVLVDNGSASASEIVTGALKDNHRATIVGEKTFGKGLIQEIMNFKRINSIYGGLKLTIGMYYTPSGAYINKKGIKPDIEIKQKIHSLNKIGTIDLMASKKKKEKDKQLEAAVKECKKKIKESL